MSLSKQRALMALRSFRTLAAAARSCSVYPSTLVRMAATDPEVSKAYQDCVGRKNAAISREQTDAVRREKKAEQRPISDSAAERNQRRLFFLSGKDPAVAVAALHGRLNRERRQDKMADLEDAIESIEAIVSNRPLSKPVRKSVTDIWDRWCGKCQAHRVDDPCEVCNRHTMIVKGDGCTTTRETNAG